MGYEKRDWEVVDYELWEMGESGLVPPGSRLARGPCPGKLQDQRFVTCLGAAQTFGVLCRNPYPALLQEAVGQPVVNLGFGGAGPSYFLNDPELIHLVNRSSLAVIQVMSARSTSNSLFESTGNDFGIRRSDGHKMAAEELFVSVLKQGQSIGPFQPKRFVPRIMAILGQQKAKQLVRECRDSYLEEYAELLDRIKVPKVLLWISKRAPDYQERYATIGEMFGEFPQLVNRGMVESLRAQCDAYVECVTSRGSPQTLFSRFTGEPVSIRHSDARPDLQSTPLARDGYYPSPEMHEDAAAALIPVCLGLLGSH
ncbi:MAG: hypothetical protein RLZZ214_3903 [Verrucomicrobiota bacterium]|jgi:hypothetical protein